jgi:hypothetical protein
MLDHFYYRPPNTRFSLNPFSSLVSIIVAQQLGGNDLPYFSSLIDHCIQTAHKEILFHNFVRSSYRACYPVHWVRPHATSRDIHAGFKHGYIHGRVFLVEWFTERWSWTSRFVKTARHSMCRLDVHIKNYPYLSTRLPYPFLLRTCRCHDL